MAHILCILASPRKSGNSASAALDALDFLHTAGHTSEQLWLCDHVVAPCVACGVCDRPPYACPLDGKRTKSSADTFAPVQIVSQAQTLSQEQTTVPLAQINATRVKVQDNAHELLERIRHADAVLLASPVYFYGPPALFKALIDRSQRYWAVDQVDQAHQVNQAHTPQSPVSPYGEAAILETMPETMSGGNLSPDSLHLGNLSPDSLHSREHGMKPAFMILTAARPAGPKLFDASLLIYRSFFSCMGFTLHDPLCLRALDARQDYARSLPSQEQVRKAGTTWISKL